MCLSPVIQPLKRAIALDHFAASELLLENGMNPNDLDVVQSPILMVLTQIPIENRIKYFGMDKHAYSC